MNVPEIIDFFIPNPDIQKRYSVIVDAPADAVYEAACNFDIQSVKPVRFIFWLREKMMGTTNSASPKEITPLTLLENGWSRLAVHEDRYLIAGSACQPWNADVVFTPIPAEHFNDYSEPDQVKIVWTFETETIDSDRTLLSTETRVVATDESSHIKFQRYWRRFGIGIIAIRLMLLPAIRRKAELITGKANKTAKID